MAQILKIAAASTFYNTDGSTTSVVGLNTTQTLTNKTLTSPALTSPVVSSGLYLYDGSHSLILQSTNIDTTNKTLTFDTGNATRSFTMGGDITTGGTLSTTGTFSSGGNFSTGSTFSTTGTFSSGGNFSTGSTFSTTGTFSSGGNFSTGSTFSTTGTFSTGGNFSTGSTFSTTGAFSTASAFTTTGAGGLTLAIGGATNLTIPAGTDTAVTLTATQTLTNKTLTSPIVGSGLYLNDGSDNLILQSTGLSGGDKTLTIDVTNGSKTLTYAGDFSTAGAFAMTLTSTAITNVTLPTTGTLATLTGTETLTNKTLTSPIIGSGLYLNDGSDNLILQSTGLSGGDKTLTIDVTNGSKTLTYAGNFTTAGAFPMTLTATASTNVTLPTTGTLATLAGTETLTNKTLGSSTSLGADLSAASFKITNLATPTSDADAANKSYVDSVATGLQVKASCVTITTADLNALSVTFSPVNTITRGSNGAIDSDLNTYFGGNGSLTSLPLGTRILVNNAGLVTNGQYRGIYTVTDVGSGSTPWVLTRSSDADNTPSTGEVSSGMYTFITNGTYISTGWILTTQNPITLNTTVLSFTQFNASSVYTAGTGLTLSGNQFTINQSGTTDTIGVNASGGLIVTSSTTANQLLLSSGTINVEPTWTSYGGTNTILYTSTTNTLASIATANNGVLITDGSGVPSITSKYNLILQTYVITSNEVLANTSSFTDIGYFTYIYSTMSGYTNARLQISYTLPATSYSFQVQIYNHTNTEIIGSVTTINGSFIGTTGFINTTAFNPTPSGSANARYSVQIKYGGGTDEGTAFPSVFGVQLVLGNV